MSATGDPVLYLSYRDVASLLDIATAIRISEDVLLEHAAGRVDWCEPRQLTLASPGFPNTTIKHKACALPGLGVAGSRVVGLNRTIEGKQAATQGPTKLIILTDPATAAILAIIDEHGSYALRTGAEVAIAVKYLARPDCHALGILGSGDMAVASLVALDAVCSPREVRVYSPTVTHREEYARRMTQELGLHVVPVATAEQAVRGCGIVCSATTAATPFVRDEWLDPGSLIYTMSPYQELETSAYQGTDKLVVDDWQQVKLEADIRAMLERGDIDEAAVYADFADLVSGRKPGRESPEERILARSQGLVTQDIAIAHWVYRTALERGIGQRLHV